MEVSQDENLCGVLHGEVTAEGVLAHDLQALQGVLEDTSTAVVRAGVSLGCGCCSCAPQRDRRAKGLPGRTAQCVTRPLSYRSDKAQARPKAEKKTAKITCMAATQVLKSICWENGH